ncbi:hypothetical protein M8C21_014169, partial [Ambrosia artemisiifolia]
CVDILKLKYDFVENPNEVSTWSKSRVAKRSTMDQVESTRDVATVDKLTGPMSLNDMLMVRVKRPAVNRTREEKGKSNEILRINGIKFVNDKFVKFDVFVNTDKLREGIVPTPCDPEYAGGFSMIPHNNKTMSSGARFGLTELLELTNSEGDEYVTVKVVPRIGCEGLTIGNITIELAKKESCTSGLIDTFVKFDRDGSGKLEANEMREALTSLDFWVSPVILDILMSKFDKTDGKNKAIKYDNFIEYSFATCEDTRGGFAYHKNNHNRSRDTRDQSIRFEPPFSLSNLTMSTSQLLVTSTITTFPYKNTPRAIKTRTNQTQGLRVSCNLAPNDQGDNTLILPESLKLVLPNLDRRTFVGLGPLYTVANLVAKGGPIITPDITAHCEDVDRGDNTLINCCPPNLQKTIKPFVFPTENTVRMRWPAHKGTPEQMKKFETAIQAMKDLPHDHPHSFASQAKIHCAYCNGAYTEFDSGFPNIRIEIHNSWLFFPFHRWYLYFFERILGKLINDPTFALPFWQWDETDGMQMPAMFVPENIDGKKNFLFGLTELLELTNSEGDEYVTVKLVPRIGCEGLTIGNITIELVDLL